jgi:hypothetical protein
MHEELCRIAARENISFRQLVCRILQEHIGRDGDDGADEF